MKEIGSEFWDVPTINGKNKIVPEHTQWFLSGRSALQAIIKELYPLKTVSLPSWCCDSIIKPFIDSGMEVHFYPVYYDKQLIQDMDLECEAVLVMDFFGYTGQQPYLKGYKGTVIRDVTHSIFSNKYSDADYYFGSLRKWCGLWTGGYAWAGDKHRVFIKQSDDFGYITLREKAMNLKSRYIQSAEGADKSYLKIFELAEECLEKVGIAPATDRDILLAQRIDRQFIVNSRRRNASILRDAFSEWLVFPELQETDCPMFVPVIVPDGKRDELRKHLIRNSIYCPVHWPVSKYHLLDERTSELLDNELSLVCDQRYTQDDMHRMVEVIKFFMEA